jgi:hypothetical protein
LSLFLWAALLGRWLVRGSYTFMFCLGGFFKKSLEKLVWILCFYILEDNFNFLEAYASAQEGELVLGDGGALGGAVVLGRLI